MHSFEELMGELMSTAEQFGHREAGAVELTAYQMAEASGRKAFPFTLPQGQGV